MIGCSSSSSFILQTAPFSGANIRVCWVCAHALGALRDIEVTISNKTFEQNGAKITFHIYNDLYLKTIEMGWWSKLDVMYNPNKL